MSNALMAPRKDRRNEAGQAIAQAIVDQYKPTDVEKMQDATMEILKWMCHVTEAVPLNRRLFQSAAAMSVELKVRPYPCTQKEWANVVLLIRLKISMVLKYPTIRYRRPHWQDNRYCKRVAEPPLKEFCTFLFVDCLYANIRKELETKARGVEDVLFISMGGVPGLGEGAKSIFKDAVAQRTVRMVRNPIKYIPPKDYKAFTAQLKKMYGPDSLKAAEAGFGHFKQAWSPVSGRAGCMGSEPASCGTAL